MLPSCVGDSFFECPSRYVLTCCRLSSIVRVGIIKTSLYHKIRVRVAPFSQSMKQPYHCRTPIRCSNNEPGVVEATNLNLGWKFIGIQFNALAVESLLIPLAGTAESLNLTSSLLVETSEGAPRELNSIVETSPASWFSPSISRITVPFSQTVCTQLGNSE
jgi:hypothetical protein